MKPLLGYLFLANGKNKNFYSLIGKKYLNKKSFPYSKKINFNSDQKRALKKINTSISGKKFNSYL